MRVSWAGRVCERKVSPMMRLYRLIAREHVKVWEIRVVRDVCGG
jgi:hypothetical protein